MGFAERCERGEFRGGRRERDRKGLEVEGDKRGEKVLFKSEKRVCG